jgi:competence protein ComEA
MLSTTGNWLRPAVSLCAGRRSAAPGASAVLAASVMLAASAVPAVSAMLVASAALAADGTAQSSQLEGEAKSLQAVCGKCHNLQIVMNTPRSLDDWRDTMQKMVDRGASGTDEQYDDILDYLHRTMTTIDVNSAEADELTTVLGASGSTVKLIIARRTTKKFVDLADLKTVPGVDAATLEAKAKLIYFQ